MEKPEESNLARTIIGTVGLLGNFPKEIQDRILEEAKDPVTGLCPLDSVMAAIARYIATTGEQPN